MKNLRIAFIGTHGVGKTTALDLVAKHLHLPKIEEQARLVAKEMGYTPATVPKYKRIAYQNRLLDRQLALEYHFDDQGFLSDRSVLDNMAYMIACEPRPVELRRYEERAYDRLGKYDLLFWFQPGQFPIQGDGERHEDEAFQMEIHGIIANLIRKYNCYDMRPWLWNRVHVVNAEGPDNRAKEILDEIQLLVEGAKPCESYLLES
jgi:thymidylate kinase